MTVDDWKALVAELVEELAAETTLYPGYEREVVTRSRAALAESELVSELTDDVLRDIYDEFAVFFDSSDGFGTTAIGRDEWSKAARAVESAVLSSRGN